MYSPLIPIYAQKFGASYFDLGLIGVAWSAPYILLSIIVGMLTDRFGRRFFFLTGIAGCVVIALLFLLTSEVWHIMVIRIINGVVYSFTWPIVEAIIVDFTTLGERTKAMGKFSFSWALGLLLGPSIGGLIVGMLDFENLFLISFIVGLPAILIALYVTIFQCKSILNVPDREELRASSGNLVFSSIYLTIMTYNSVVGLIFGIFPAYVESLGMDAFQIGMLFSILGIARAITFLYSERIARMGEKRSIILALAIQSLSLSLITYLHDYASLLLLVTMLGFSLGLLNPISLSIASKIAPTMRIGATMGITESFSGLGMTLGPLLGGAIAGLMDSSYPYVLFGGAVAILLLSILLSSFRG